jgi:hypothetical protein
MTLMTLWYIGYHSPYGQKRRNMIEAFNEICVVLCNYLVMLFMLSDNAKFLDYLTIAFIIIVAINILFFALPAVVALIQEPYHIYSRH